MSMKHIVFVYGSLKKGFGNSRLLKDSVMVTDAKTVEEYSMISLGSFPGVLPKGEHPTHIVGEVYAVDDETFDRLDGLEGHPDFYKREEVELDAGYKAWMYIYQGDRYYSEDSYIQDGVW